MEDERPVAWTAVPELAPVFDTSGATVGTAVSVLGNTVHDIFHGVVIKRETDGKLVELPAEDVEQITTERIRITRTTAEVDDLPVYEGDISGRDGLLFTHKPPT
jgi:hypothetical protein